MVVARCHRAEVVEVARCHQAEVVAMLEANLLQVEGHLGVDHQLKDLVIGVADLHQVEEVDLLQVEEIEVIEVSSEVDHL